MYYNMSVSEGSIEIKEYPPHTVWTVQAKIPDGLVERISPDDFYASLTEYLAIHNSHITAARFGAYNAEIYTCPCGCGDYLYISIYR